MHREVKVNCWLHLLCLFVQEREVKKRTRYPGSLVQMRSQCGMKGPTLFHEPFLYLVHWSEIKLMLLYYISMEKKKKALIWKFAYSPTKLISLFSVSTKAKYIARSNVKCMGFLKKCINCDWEFSFVTEGDVLKIRLTFLKDLFTLVYMHPHPIYLLFFSSYSYFSFLLSKYSYYTRLY